MYYRNNPGTGNHHYPPHGGHRPGQSQHNQSFGAKSGGFNFGGDLPTMVPIEPAAPTQELLPVSIAETSTAELVETTAAPAAKAGGFTLPNLTEIKGFVDRMGGIDGIVSTVQKVQKVVSSVSQMAPLVKVLWGSFGKKSATVSEDDSDEWKPKRRKRRKTGKSSGNGSGRRRKPKRPR
ncbi:MAG: tyrosine protein kinase [Bacillota bacterium]